MGRFGEDCGDLTGIVFGWRVILFHFGFSCFSRKVGECHFQTLKAQLRHCWISFPDRQGFGFPGWSGTGASGWQVRPGNPKTSRPSVLHIAPFKAIFSERWQTQSSALQGPAVIVSRKKQVFYWPTEGPRQCLGVKKETGCEVCCGQTNGLIKGRRFESGRLVLKRYSQLLWKPRRKCCKW